MLLIILFALLVAYLQYGGSSRSQTKLTVGKTVFVPVLVGDQSDVLKQEKSVVSDIVDKLSSGAVDASDGRRPVWSQEHALNYKPKLGVNGGLYSSPKEALGETTQAFAPLITGWILADAQADYLPPDELNSSNSKRSQEASSTVKIDMLVIILLMFIWVAAVFFTVFVKALAEKLRDYVK